jgi:hypothetical protein
MWNRRKEEEFVPKSLTVPPTSSELAKEGIPMSTLPGRLNEPQSDSRGGPAVLGKSVIVKGQIFSREDLTVGPNGKVKASVKAREVVVLGTIHGDVETSDKIEIRKDAKLVGDIKTARIGIEDGAYFKGNIDIIRPDTRPAANGQKPQAASSTPPSVSGPAMAAGAGGSGSHGPSSGSSLGPTEVKR